MRLRFHHRAFTLIELMLVIAIAVVIFAIAMPSLSGLSAERRLLASFEQFDAFVRGTQLKAMSQQRSCTLVWQAGVITSEVDDLTAEERLTGAEAVSESFSFGEDETYTIERPASLLAPKDTPPAWTFWRTGTCEPVRISYSGPAGTWTAQYDPLTGHGELTNQLVPIKRFARHPARWEDFCSSKA